MPPSISHGNAMNFVVEKSPLVGKRVQQVSLDVKPHALQRTALGTGSLQVKVEDFTHLIHGSL
jgi:hypothetical protein